MIPHLASAPTDITREIYSRPGAFGCFSRLRYAFLERWTLCEGVFNRSFTGAFGFGTRMTTFSFSRFRLTGRCVRESAGRGGARGSHESASTPRRLGRPSADASRRDCCVAPATACDPLDPTPRHQPENAPPQRRD